MISARRNEWFGQVVGSQPFPSPVSALPARCTAERRRVRVLITGVIIYNSIIPMEAVMIENQTPQEQAPAASSNKWIWWIVGGGCVLLLCAAMVVAGFVLYFWPLTSR